MINLAVINLKGLLKKIIKLSLIIIVFVIIINFIKILDFENMFSNVSIASTENIEKNIIITQNFRSEDKTKKSNIKKILEKEFALFMTTEEKLMELENQEEDIEFEDLENVINNSEKEKNTENKSVNQINSNENHKPEDKVANENKEENTIIEKVDLNNLPTIAKTRVITENNKEDKHTDIYKSVKIRNESKYVLDEKTVTPDYELTNKKDILLFHTHTCESYTKTANSVYEESGNFRTINLDYNVAAIGREFSNILTPLGFNIIHNVTYHDYPAYSGSYSRSLKTVKNLLEKNKDIELVIDIHRDALGSNSNYGPKVEINGENVAQLMFVIGTDGGGLTHDNWKNNLKTAIKIQEKANEMYPGLFKPIILRNSRYNQHVTNGAFIIEVGATGNTIDECKGSMKYFAKVLAEVLK